jgi:putative RNA 2'-phosphotransferase
MRVSRRHVTIQVLSRVLRHDPGSIGISLEEGGWTSVDRLLLALAEYGKGLSRDALEELCENVATPRLRRRSDGRAWSDHEAHGIAGPLGSYRATC